MKSSKKGRCFLSLDVGTTCCKCQLFSEKGEILAHKSEEYPLLEKTGERYVNIKEIFSKIKEMMRYAGFYADFDSVCISSFGESFVLLDEKDEILFDPMLYTDPRGEAEAEELLQKFGAEKMFTVTGTVPQSMYSISKLLWIKKNRPELLARTRKIFLICDYIGYLFTGERVIDYALAARTGAFDINALEFSAEILGACGISSSLFSAPMPTGSVVGKVRRSVLDECGVKGDITLVLGSHDQVCSALGAGAVNAGDAVDGMGTVECITPIFTAKPNNAEMGKEGYVCVPYAVQGLYCTYMFNYSCGSLINWYRKDILHGYKGEEWDVYSYLERADGSPSGILVLPYFAGAATPYQNINAKGAIINLSTRTSDADIYKGILEGTAMEMRLNAENVQKYGIGIRRIVATGGGANSEKWLSLKASIQGVNIRTLRSSEGGLCGCAMLQAKALGLCKNWQDIARVFVKYGKEFAPDAAVCAAYEGQYRKYKKLYQTVKEFY